MAAEGHRLVAVGGMVATVGVKVRRTEKPSVLQDNHFRLALSGYILHNTSGDAECAGRVDFERVGGIDKAAREAGSASQSRGDCITAAGSLAISLVGIPLVVIADAESMLRFVDAENFLGAESRFPVVTSGVLVISQALMIVNPGKRGIRPASAGRPRHVQGQTARTGIIGDLENAGRAGGLIQVIVPPG